MKWFLLILILLVSCSPYIETDISCEAVEQMTGIGMTIQTAGMSVCANFCEKKVVDWSCIEGQVICECS